MVQMVYDVCGLLAHGSVLHIAPCVSDCECDYLTILRALSSHYFGKMSRKRENKSADRQQ